VTTLRETPDDLADLDPLSSESQNEVVMTLTDESQHPDCVASIAGATAEHLVDHGVAVVVEPGR
jgi:hypothetical protein